MPAANVCVIGGGPAGLAAAIALRLAGAVVVLFDARQPPIDKACGEGLMPNTLAALGELGVRLSPDDGKTFRGIRFIDGRGCVSLDFRQGNGLGLRRTQLHSALVARAMELGVDLRWNVRNAQECLDALRPDLAVGADGWNSRVRERAAFVGKTSGLRYGFRQHFLCVPWSDYVEIYCGRRRQMYVTPVGQGEVGIALLTSNARERIADVLPYFPALERQLHGAKPNSRGMGAVTATRVLRRVTKPGLALVGDASGSVDAITGEGIGLALEQAIALGRALREGNLAQYERAYEEIAHGPRRLARVLLGLSRNSFAQSAALRVAGWLPEMGAAVLAAYVRRPASMTRTGWAGSGSISLPNPERLNSQS